MLFIVGGMLLSAVYFVLLLLLTRVGRWYGRRRLADDPERGLAGTGPVEGAVFALYGLFIAFSFSGALERFSERRKLVIQELNDVGTAWMRLDLLPTKDQPPVREAFRRYVASRVELQQKWDDEAAFDRIAGRIDAHRKEIWARSVSAFKESGINATTSLTLGSQNEMFDTWDQRRAARYEHTPYALFVLLYGLGLVSAFFAGNAMAPSARPYRAFAVIFALLSAVTVYFIVDIEYPRHGLIRIDSIDVIIRQLLQEIGPPG